MSHSWSQEGGEGGTEGGMGGGWEGEGGRWGGGGGGGGGGRRGGGRRGGGGTRRGDGGEEWGREGEGIRKDHGVYLGESWRLSPSARFHFVIAYPVPTPSSTDPPHPSHYTAAPPIPLLPPPPPRRPPPTTLTSPVRKKLFFIYTFCYTRSAWDKVCELLDAEDLRVLMEFVLNEAHHGEKKLDALREQLQQEQLDRPHQAREVARIYGDHVRANGFYLTSIHCQLFERCSGVGVLVCRSARDGSLQLTRCANTPEIIAPSENVTKNSLNISLLWGRNGHQHFDVLTML